MTETIEIKSSRASWRFTINLSAALPSFSIGDFQKMLRYADEDFDHRDEIIEDVREYLSDRLDRLPDEMKKTANEYANVDQIIKGKERQLEEIRASIKNKRTSTFMSLSKDQIEDLKEKRNDLIDNLRDWREDRKIALSHFKTMEREKKKFEKEMEVLKEWKP